MIAYVKGPIVFKSPQYLILDNQGIGYKIFISLYTYAAIEKEEQVRLFTYFHVKEDSHTLYGFAEEGERTFFEWLISVSGVGPNTAMSILSSMRPAELRSALISENVAAFKRVKGVGPKMAQRLILDLKDKVLKDGGEIDIPALSSNNTIANEALSALVSLGIARVRAQKAIQTILRENPKIADTEQLIKDALRAMS